MGAMFLDSGFDMSVIDAFFDTHFAEFFDTDDPPTIQRHPMVRPLLGNINNSPCSANISNSAAVQIGNSRTNKKATIQQDLRKSTKWPVKSFVWYFSPSSQLM
jgi:RIP homotypic interaction motif